MGNLWLHCRRWSRLLQVLEEYNSVVVRRFDLSRS
jgi:hypothetical protein